MHIIENCTYLSYLSTQFLTKGRKLIQKVLYYSAYNKEWEGINLNTKLNFKPQQKYIYKCSMKIKNLNKCV